MEILTEYDGEITQDNNQAKEDQFLKLSQLLEQMVPFIKNKLFEFKRQLEIMNNSF